MPVFARRTTIKRQFGARRAPGGAIQCYGCNCNLADTTSNSAGTIYVLYADKIQLKVNRQFDVYCRDCITRSFPKAVMV
jgi:hypothetical protein